MRVQRSDGLVPANEPIRTDLHCTECGRNFIALLNLRIDGNHVVECPYCRHEHCRVVQGGYVTGDRWDSRAQRTIKIEGRNVWKAGDQPIMTTGVSAFLRDRWLNRDDS